MSRPKDSTVRKLFALSRNRCAFPECSNPIIDSESNVTLGEVCHICAQSHEGPRFNSRQSEEERHSFENLILLCENHHKIIDDKKNIQKYTVEYLIEVKNNHEKTTIDAKKEVSAISDLVVLELIKNIKVQKVSKVHMDFRGATLKAGGEGGQLGGGGGSGGVINIIGVTPQGFHEPIDGNGENGKFPGGGGGGAGQVNFLGRPAEVTDIDLGLRVSSLFLANAVNTVNGLLYILGAGWSWCEVQKTPTTLNLNIVCIIETGLIPINTLLRIDYSILDPDGQTHLKSHFDLSVLDNGDVVRRWNKHVYAMVNIKKVGIWKIHITSGGQRLFVHEMEIRLPKK